MPIIVGAPRSGTTLLRLILDCHPDLAIPPETGFFLLESQLAHVSQNELKQTFYDLITSYPAEAFAWADYHISNAMFWEHLNAIQPFNISDGFRLFYRIYAERFGKSRWGDKTPMYHGHLLDIQSLLPEARFIHLIRDGRDVAVSLRQQWFSPGSDIETQARFWRDIILTAQEQGRRCSHYLEVHFESLICNLEHELRRICDFIDLPFHTAVLNHSERAGWRIQEHQARHFKDGRLLVSQETRLRQQQHSVKPPDRAKIGMAKQCLTDEELKAFERISGDTLRQLGYPLYLPDI